MPPHEQSHHDVGSSARVEASSNDWTASTGDGAATAEPSAFPPPPPPSHWLRRAARRFWPGREGAATSPEALGAALLDAVPDPFLLVDGDDRIRTVNEAFGAVYGYDLDELTGTWLADSLLAPAQREAYHALRQSHADAASARLAVRHADGFEVPTDVDVRPVADASRRLYGVRLRDAREVQAAEVARDVAEGQRQTLHTVLDAIPEAVVALDRTGRVVFRNRASSSGLHGDVGLTEAQWHASDGVMRTGMPVFGQEEPGPSGGVRLTSRIPVRNGAGAVVGLVAISRDVTAHKAAEARLVEGKRAAEAAARANSEFLATTSHEVRTLMSGVTGMTTLLLDSALDDEQRDFVETIRTSGAALLAIVNDVLDLSKIDAGMLEIEARPYDVRQLVRESLAMLAQQAAAKGIGLTSDVADTVPEMLLGDAGRVRQVLVNLLTNAIKFTDEGSVRVGVRLVAGATGTPMLAVSVRDTGVGIAPERLEAVFERFVQADSSTSRVHGGTGLGLTICRRLVNMMGGELSAESVPGGGSVFRFTVGLRTPGPAQSEASASDVPLSEPRFEPSVQPASDPPAPASAEANVRGPEPVAEAAPETATLVSETLVAAGETLPPTPEPALAPPPSQKVMATDSILPSARVLLVEDDPIMQKVTSMTLRRLGYSPTVAPDGAKAVVAVRREAFDVVLMDIMMPVMDGFEATRQIRADPGRHPAPAIVALTANAMQGDRERCLDAGCDDYLSKPVAPRELASTIERAIRARKGAA